MKTSCGAFLRNLCHCLIITLIIPTILPYPFGTSPTQFTFVWSHPLTRHSCEELCSFQDIRCSAGNIIPKTILETGIFDEKLISGFYISTNECCCSTLERKFESNTRTLVKRKTTSFISKEFLQHNSFTILRP